MPPPSGGALRHSCARSKFLTARRKVSGDDRSPTGLGCGGDRDADRDRNRAPARVRAPARDGARARGPARILNGPRAVPPLSKVW